MALGTGGTSTTSVLKAILVGGANDTPANRALFNAAVKDAFPVTEGSTNPPTATYTPQGIFLPERGLINLVKGDYVMVDPTSGVVIIVAAVGVTGGSFVVSGA